MRQMYDYIVIGQGLTGMLSAIWARERGASVALISQGEGRIIQSTGVMDLIPGDRGNIIKMLEEYNINSWDDFTIKNGIDKFKSLLNRLDYPYHGNIYNPVEIITGSGHLKSTGLYPETIQPIIQPIPEKGHIMIIGFREIADFQPKYIKGNLSKDRPELKISTMNISLGKRSLRTMTQLDAARMLEDQENRKYVLKQIKEQLKVQSAHSINLFVFPSALGILEWKVIIEELKEELQAPVTEAVGMPPNAAAIRLYEVLKKEMIRLGVRLYSNTQVIGSKVENDILKSIKIKNSISGELKAKKYVIAAGGIIGGGLEQTAKGLKEKVLGIEINQNGEYLSTIKNVYLVGASQGMHVIRNGITGGVFSILSSYTAIKQAVKEDTAYDQYVG